jgi:hypothetical protein
MRENRKLSCYCKTNKAPLSNWHQLLPGNHRVGAGGAWPSGGVGMDVLAAVATGGGQDDDAIHVLLSRGARIWTAMESGTGGSGGD